MNLLTWVRKNKLLTVIIFLILVILSLVGLFIISVFVSIAVIIIILFIKEKNISQKKLDLVDQVAIIDQQREDLQDQATTISQQIIYIDSITQDLDVQKRKLKYEVEEGAKLSVDLVNRSEAVNDLEKELKNAEDFFRERELSKAMAPIELEEYRFKFKKLMSRLKRVRKEKANLAKQLKESNDVKVNLEKIIGDLNRKILS